MAEKRIMFISDMHFGHANIINLCSRPFSSVEEMNSSLISNWNLKVRDTDTVYVVGDMFFTGEDPCVFLKELKGEKILITGNHDRTSLKKHREALDFFSSVQPYLEISESGHLITLCHYPMLEWYGDRRTGSRKLGYHIYGHIHNNVLSEYHVLFMKANALNAGADINGFTPATFDELVKNNERYRLSVLRRPSDKARFILCSRCMHLSDDSKTPLLKTIDSVLAGMKDEEKAADFMLACAIRYGGYECAEALRFFGNEAVGRALTISVEEIMGSGYCF